MRGRGHLRRPQQLPGRARPEPSDLHRNLIAPPILVLTNDQEKKKREGEKSGYVARSFRVCGTACARPIRYLGFFFFGERGLIAGAECFELEIYNIKGEGVKMLLTIEIEVWWKYIYIYKLKMPLTWFIRKDGNIWGGREFMTWHYWIRSWLYFCEK